MATMSRFSQCPWIYFTKEGTGSREKGDDDEALSPTRDGTAPLERRKVVFSCCSRHPEEDSNLYMHVKNP